MMRFPRNIVSAFLTALFAVVAISGVLMFFKIRLLAMESLHIWLGLAFVLMAVFHLAKNWTAFGTYFKKKSTLLSIGVVCVVCAIFVAVPLLDTTEKGVNPKQKIFSTVMSVPLSNVAQFFKLDGEMMVKNLYDQRQIIATTQQSVGEITRISGKSSDEILQIILSAPTKQ